MVKGMHKIPASIEKGLEDLKKVRTAELTEMERRHFKGGAIKAALQLAEINGVLKSADELVSDAKTIHAFIEGA